MRATRSSIRREQQQTGETQQVSLLYKQSFIFNKKLYIFMCKRLKRFALFSDQVHFSPTPCHLDNVTNFNYNLIRQCNC